MGFGDANPHFAPYQERKVIRAKEIQNRISKLIDDGEEPDDNPELYALIHIAIDGENTSFAWADGTAELIHEDRMADYAQEIAGELEPAPDPAELLAEMTCEGSRHGYLMVCFADVQWWLSGCST